MHARAPLSFHGLLFSSRPSSSLHFLANHFAHCRLAENHRSDAEEELLEMETERRKSVGILDGDDMSVKPKKRNQMNTGMKGLR